MPHTRGACIRGLRLYREDDEPPPATDGDGLEALHARSRFRSLAEPERVALYSVHDGRAGAPPPRDDEHTLVVVREFRRVPLHATTLALMVTTASRGRAAQAAATLAHFAELAVSRYQPVYLLLAHSLEDPRLNALLAGVHEYAALAAGHAAAFSVEALLPELRPLLECEPEWFAYCPEPRAEPLAAGVSPYAV
ncbi:MAG TPA: hypothetical protein VFX28_07770 [Methylomirabilota bacterium]|nr:hypothetical protein [Methylomirabilota bacterium]